MNTILFYNVTIESLNYLKHVKKIHPDIIIDSIVFHQRTINDNIRIELLKWIESNISDNFKPILFKDINSTKLNTFILLYRNSHDKCCCQYINELKKRIKHDSKIMYELKKFNILNETKLLYPNHNISNVEKPAHGFIDIWDVGDQTYDNYLLMLEQLCLLNENLFCDINTERLLLLIKEGYNKQLLAILLLLGFMKLLQTSDSRVENYQKKTAEWLLVLAGKNESFCNFFTSFAGNIEKFTEYIHNNYFGTLFKYFYQVQDEKENENYVQLSKHKLTKIFSDDIYRYDLQLTQNNNSKLYDNIVHMICFEKQTRWPKYNSNSFKFDYYDNSCLKIIITNGCINLLNKLLQLLLKSVKYCNKYCLLFHLIEETIKHNECKNEYTKLNLIKFIWSHNVDFFKYLKNVEYCPESHKLKFIIRLNGFRNHMLNNLIEKEDERNYISNCLREDDSLIVEKMIKQFDLK